MKKGTKIAVVSLVIVFLVLAVRFISGGPEDSWTYENENLVQHGNPAEKFSYNNASSDNITVNLPYPGAVVGKEFSVIGKARGTWFFEASFPVQVLDKDGNVLFATPAQAQSDWMTENFVSFKADIQIPQSYIGPATLILEKDNPSGILSKDASISFPINIEY
jgi:hypothetical protein